MNAARTLTNRIARARPETTARRRASEPPFPAGYWDLVDRCLGETPGAPREPLFAAERRSGRTLPPLVALWGAFDDLLDRAHGSGLEPEALVARLGESLYPTSLPETADVSASPNELAQIRLHAGLCHYVMTFLLVARASRRFAVPLESFHLRRCQVVFRAWSRERHGPGVVPAAAEWGRLEETLAVYGTK